MMVNEGFHHSFNTREDGGLPHGLRRGRGEPPHEVAIAGLGVRQGPLRRCGLVRTFRGHGAQCQAATALERTKGFR